MKVTVSVGGRFHAFHLAHQLWSRGCLAQVVTTIPGWRIGNGVAPGVPFISIPAPEALMYLSKGLPWPGFGEWAELWKARLFDWRARNYVAGCDLLHVFANFALQSMARVREWGAVTVLDRASAHASVQREIIEEEYGRFGMKRRSVHPALEERALREYQEADFILVPSSFARSTFVAQGFDPTKLLVVPLGVDAGIFPARATGEGRFRVLYVGGISLRKGIPYLLEAMSRLPRDAEVLLVGVVTPEIRPVLDRYAGRFTVRGPVRQGELSQIYAEASVFVLPSVEDGFGLVALEAMSCGLPVVVSTNAGVSDVVREGVDGFLVPPRDVEGMRERIARLYESPSLASTMGECARSRAREFSWEAYGRRVTSMYANLLGDRRAAAL